MNILKYSSRSIFIPALVALYLGRWTDFLVICGQASASVWYHSNNTPLALFVDRTALAVLMLRTLLLALTSKYTIGLYIFGFGYIGVMYLYGYKKKCLAFDERQIVADAYHASMHVVGICIYSGSMIWLV